MKKLCPFILVIALTLSISCNIGSSISTPTPASGTIRGIFWRDTCKFTGGEAGQPVVLGQGCVQWGPSAGDFGANQVKDDFEAGMPAVTLHLGLGACPSTGLGTALTNASGEYQFAGLSAGTYCVSYSPLTDGNDAILIPGEPTFPARGEDGISATIALSAGNVEIVNFGYSMQNY
jgi:hypothetical protein